MDDPTDNELEALELLDRGCSWKRPIRYDEHDAGDLLPRPRPRKERLTSSARPLGAHKRAKAHPLPRTR